MDSLKCQKSASLRDMQNKVTQEGSKYNILKKINQANTNMRLQKF